MIDAPARPINGHHRVPERRRARVVPLGRLLRRLVGVDERLLNEVPQERARYTSLATIVVSTALIAAFSLWSAASLLLPDVPWILLAPIALVWAAIVANLDRFLITGMHGTASRARWGGFGVRLLIAIVLGLFIAEPLTLKIFQSRLDQEIAATRTAALDHRESELRRCNPLEGPVPAGCEGDLLNGSEKVAAADGTVGDKEKDVAALTRKLTQDRRDVARLRRDAQLECNGTGGDGRTGKVGVGPSCRQLRTDLGKLERAVDLPAQERALAAAQRGLGEVATAKAQVRTERAAEIERGIAAKLAEKRAESTTIGLAERWEALGRVSSESGFVLFMHWLLRIFLVLFDCLPIISKLLNGTTRYDELVTRELQSSLRRHDAELAFNDRKVVGGYENLLYEEEQAIQRRKRDADLRQRIEVADQDREAERFAAGIVRRLRGESEPQP
ncbi:DUF4407 domain-containing protein [Nonomuraea sp. NPDC050310]|uniref:DUF4407 domain-containing protein n=1 Tax=Nonomuraea sp. NPDC050310 TaxID=3154935 RepID=UPI0033DB1359